MEAVMNLNSIQINLQLGQEILVGKKQEKARITKIEHFEKSGDIVINTTRGTRKVLTFKLCPVTIMGDPADQYR
tara:strand:+ start:513 stop:734 length:222 start_codon:yes stop_codon:yes gene_type:complete